MTPPFTQPTAAATRGLLLLGAVLAAQSLLVYLQLHERAGALVDDAFISFRYAARWAQGLGWTWNDGVAVEGFSNPLWTGLLGVAARAGLAPHTLAPGLGTVFLLATSIVLWGLARARGFGFVPTLVLLGGWGLDVGAATWAGSGLETASAGFWVAVWLLVASGVDRDQAGFPRGLVLGLAGSLLALSRPEGIVWALLGLGWLLWAAWSRGRLVAGWFLGMVPFGAYLAFRWTEFGQLLPNTFFAKFEPDPGVASHGLATVGAWALAHAALLFFLVVAWGAGSSATRRPDDAPRLWWLLPAGLAVFGVGFVVVVGGDWMGATRYVAPLLPALYVLAAEVAERAGFAAAGARRGVAVTLILAAHISVGWHERDRLPDYTNIGRELGLWLADVAAPDDVIAVTAAGAIPYFSERPAYDVLGINDPEVAGRKVRHTGAWMPGHHRYDLDRLLDLAPRWIVWDFGVQVNRTRIKRIRVLGGDPDKLDYRQSLFARERFHDLYAIDTDSPPNTQHAYTVFRRR